MRLDPAVVDTLLHDPARLTAGQRAEIARRLAVPVGWTREATEQLAALWQSGASGSLIAAAINRDHGTAFSRNAVIGKINRLGLARRAVGVPRSAKPRAARRARPGDGRRAFPSPLLRLARLTLDTADRVAVDDIGPPVGRRCSLLELDDATCRWPVGDPRTPEFYFCGGKPLAGRPYCVHHAAVAYQPETECRHARRPVRRRRRFGIRL
jgi:GcrA cell cycle regulator